MSRFVGVRKSGIPVLAGFIAAAAMAPASSAAPPVADQIAGLEELEREGRLDSGRARRLARLIVESKSRSPAESARRWSAVEQAFAAFQMEMDGIRTEGAPRVQPTDDRWLKLAVSTEEPLAKALFERVFLDQWQLKYDGGLDAVGSRALSALAGPEIRANIRANASWLKAVLARIGWFDISKFGEDASQAAWLLVQHSDHDRAWQERVLVDLERRVARGDMQARYYAYLSDRVATNAKRPQRYGTQGRCVGPGDWQPFETADPEGLDARRAALGLDPIAEYRKHFTCI